MFSDNQTIPNGSDCFGHSGCNCLDLSRRLAAMRLLDSGGGIDVYGYLLIFTDDRTSHG